MPSPTDPDTKEKALLAEFFFLFFFPVLGVEKSLQVYSAKKGHKSYLLSKELSPPLPAKMSFAPGSICLAPTARGLLSLPCTTPCLTSPTKNKYRVLEGEVHGGGGGRYLGNLREAWGALGSRNPVPEELDKRNKIDLHASKNREERPKSW